METQLLSLNHLYCSSLQITKVVHLLNYYQNMTVVELHIYFCTVAWIFLHSLAIIYIECTPADWYKHAIQY